jgi:hypothetical protein
MGIDYVTMYVGHSVVDPVDVLIQLLRCISYNYNFLFELFLQT